MPHLYQDHYVNSGLNCDWQPMKYTTNSNTFVMSWYSEAAKVPSFMLTHECNHLYIEQPATDIYQRHVVLSTQSNQIMKEDHLVKVSHDMVTRN